MNRPMSTSALLGSILALLVSLLSLNARAQTPNHGLWDNLLQRHVTDEGHVDYAGFCRDSAALDAYLHSLEQCKPATSGWTDDARKAFWINAYNAFTVRLVMRYYPLASIKDIGGNVQLPFVNTAWDIHFIAIEDELLDLNNVEHRKLRAAFGDPRIHFAIVCASTSCPSLRNHAYLPDDLDGQLDQATHDFLQDPTRNQVAGKSPRLSKIFEWYRSDFTQGQTLIAFVNRYIAQPIAPRTKLKFLPYDWSLNRQP